MKQWYEKLFANYAKKYDQECFVQGTINEVDFIEREIQHNKAKTILDIGSGTGRHAIELAKRGYDVTGLDLSEAQIKRAREKARDAGVNINFLSDDARSFKLNKKFDLAIILCEGAFSLMENDEMNFAILKNAFDHLREQGKIILTCLNALYPLFHSIKDFHDQNITSGISFGNTFDVTTFRDYSSFEFTDDDGKSHTINCNERYFTAPEINWYLKSIGFMNIDIMGCETGNFSRNIKLSDKQYELLAIAEK